MVCEDHELNDPAALIERVRDTGDLLDALLNDPSTIEHITGVVFVATHPSSVTLRVVVIGNYPKQTVEIIKNFPFTESVLSGYDLSVKNLMTEINRVTDHYINNKTPI